MLGIFLIYFIGKSFYNLAEKHGRSKWGFAILGVVVYYAMQVLLTLILILLENEEVLSNTLLISLMAIAAGGIGDLVFYRILSNTWEKRPKITHSQEDLLDQ
jgi:hypothetical protein